MQHLLFIIFSLIPSLFFAQKVLPVAGSTEEIEVLKHLNESAFFRANKYQNHEVVNMVNVFTVDSSFTRKFERHRVVGGGIIRLLGFRWKAASKTRQKLVGWVNRTYLHDINKEAQFTEYDINYDLIPLLPAYKDLAYNVYQMQFDMKKSKKKKFEGQAPYVYPTEEMDMTKYRFHCENTPATNFRSLLNTKFFPVHRNNDLTKHHNFEEAHPVMGMYGVMVLDCNHSCHPEIHPYEWVWWLNLTEEKTSWNVGFIRDVSNRFKHWSSSPRTGQISLPFNFPLNTSNWTLEIDHQMFGNFSEEGFLDMELNANYENFNFESRTYSFDNSSLTNRTLTVKSNMKIPYESIQYAIENIRLNEAGNSLSGTLNLAMSISDVYTAEIKMDYTDLESDYSQLLQLMEGSFTNKLQAQNDSDYLDISRHIYPIWESLEAGWFYVEEALALKPNSPMRQRIYKVDQIDAATFKSTIYIMPNDSLCIGKWNDANFFSLWQPSDLKLEEGCAIYLKKIGDKLFEGGTLKGTCISDFGGAVYATSKVKLSSASLNSWDQGFDAEGLQTWGAEKGAYEFRKK
jgi:hypothetical protein